MRRVWRAMGRVCGGAFFGKIVEIVVSGGNLILWSHRRSHRERSSGKVVLEGIWRPKPNAR